MQKDIEKKAIDHITKSFLQCLEDDIYPPENFEKVFGIELTHTTETLEITECTIGNLTANVWLELYHQNTLVESDIASALARGSLPTYFEEKARKLFEDTPSTSPFSCELVRRGFSDIPWDIFTLDILCRPSSSSEAQ